MWVIPIFEIIYLPPPPSPFTKAAALEPMRPPPPSSLIKANSSFEYFPSKIDEFH